MSAPVETLRIENVVASTAVDQELDLETVAGDLDGTQYDPDQFPGIVYRLQDPNAACLIFRSGKIVCTGAESIADMEEAIEAMFEALGDLGLEVPADPEVTVQNIVTSGDLGDELNLNAVAVGFGLENVEYEPEQFPGLVYRPENHDVVTLLFGSGKFVVTGGTEPEDAEHAIETIAADLSEFDLLG